MLSQTGFDCSRIVHGVADHYGVTVSDLRGRRRFRRIVEPRYVAAWLLRQYGLTFIELGEEFNRDHSTMVQAIRVVEERMRRDDVYRARVMGLRKRLLKTQENYDG